MINWSFVVQFWLKCWIICPQGVTRPIINTLLSQKYFIPRTSAPTISHFVQTIASMSIYLQSDGWVQFFSKIFRVDIMVIIEAVAAECRGWKPELSLLTTKQIPNFQRFSSKLPCSTMKTTSEIIAAAWKWHWAPLNNNQISWYKTQLHFSSSQRSWSACYILLTAGYLWFMDGVINKPFLKFNSNPVIEDHSPLDFLK